MNIYITLNDVLRDTFGKMKEVYEKYTKKEAVEPITNMNLKEFFEFEEEDGLKEFLYIEASMEIFGAAKEKEKNCFSFLHEFFKDFPDSKITLLSDELGKGKAATLWFLAKYGCCVDKILFYKLEDLSVLCEEADYFITADPNILKNTAGNKKTIKLITEYNKTIKADFEIDKFSDIKNIITNEK
jgi:hypothetical protein|tara:strand:+ start:8117 stop:8671 length:555 start_codon:yes stop_codon:yes gene_type:complete